MLDGPRVHNREGCQLELLAGGSPQHDAAEGELLARGIVPPLPHRAVWARFKPAAEFWFLLLRDAAGQVAGGFMLEVAKSRALPGHLLLLGERLGESLSPRRAGPAFSMLAELVRRDSRVLRLDIEVFSPDSCRRQQLGAALADAGFESEPLSRSYVDTLTADLPTSEAEHLAALSANTRRHVRAVLKNPVQIREIDNPALAPRLDTLMRETLERTGGVYRSEDWEWRIALSRAAPGQSRLVGLCRTDASDPESLLAFAWGCHHGGYAHYDAAASTRRTDLRMSFSYALMWDLMCWARAHGARWFDFGGITEGNRDSSDDPVGGISDFKRHFGSVVQRVGERWSLEPSPLRSGVAKGVMTLARVLRTPHDVLR